ANAGGDPGACSQIGRAVGQFRRLAGVARQVGSQGAVGPLLAAAFPDRVALLRDGQHNRYLLSGGQGSRLPANDPLTSSQWLVVAQLGADKVDARIHLAAKFSEAELREHFSEQVLQKSMVYWHPRQSRVMADKREQFGAITLTLQPLGSPDPEAVRSAMLTGIINMGLTVLNFNRECHTLQARVELMAKIDAAGGWPDLQDKTLLATLEHWLGPYLDGISKSGQLQQLDMANILKNQFSWSQLQQLEREVPTHYKVPSGSNIRLQYGLAQPPILAVKVQELFGLTQTPTICLGRLPLTLHLLSPAQRPLQVTSDLKNFWQQTWPEVRKEMQGRYPKHYWPQDPWSAQATSRSKPRTKK
ncbi:MAG: ATP-dependent helicase HrpB, partial [Magnetococcales bacterium]|nr:ATP-dependent helicase HrpB [Magnetococcales bacterium]